jgi:hypothetical protein
MDLKEYRKENYLDEAILFFPNHSLRDSTIPYANGQVVKCSNHALATEIHHLCGSGGGAKRVNSLANVIHLCNKTHVWMEENKLAGFVVCCYAKKLKGELDFEELSRIKGKCLPSWLETDQVIQCCEVFPWVEELRKELL